MPIYVNKVEITDDEVHREMQYHPADSVEKARYQAAQALVIRELLRQKACEKGLLEDRSAETSPENEEASIEALLEQEVTVPEANETTCRRYYEQNSERFSDAKTGETLPFNLVEARIRQYLHTRSMRTGISQYLKILAGEAKIAGFQLETSDSPLVQ